MENSESRNALSLEAESDDFASPTSLSPAETRVYWRGVADGLVRAGVAVPAAIAERAEAPPQAAAADGPGPRERHDAFTGARKQLYLKALAKTGCKLDACSIVGVSSSTVYNHERDDPEFDRQCRLALAMSATPIELTAYERGVVGIEEDVIRGGQVVGTRIRRSDYMLRILLQGSNPKKYGPRPGFRRKRLLKFERKQMEREIRASLKEHRPPVEQVTETIVRQVNAIRRHRDQTRRAEGWTELGCGIWVPPGWVWTGEGDPRDAIANIAKNSDAVSSSSNSSTSPPNLPPDPRIA